MRSALASTQRSERGQAAVESAIALPLTLFVILGIIQMAMVQQARMMADYAAYKGARAASVGQAECEAISKAEIAALVPTLGRADSAAQWIATYNKYSGNRRGSRPVVFTEYRIDNRVFPFDKLLPPSAAPEKIHLRLHYFFQLEIPFANWLIARYFLAQRGLESWANMSDPLSPARTTSAPRVVSASADAVIARNYFNSRVYVVPVRASWSLRMFSQAAQTQGSCQ